MLSRWPPREVPTLGESKAAMKKQKVSLYAFAVTTALVVSGCFSLSWAHNRRHVRKFIDELVALHEDIDKVIFGLDRNPSE